MSIKNNYTNDHRDYCIGRGIRGECRRYPFPVNDVFPLCKNIKCDLTKQNIIVLFKRKLRDAKYPGWVENNMMKVFQ